MPHLDMLHCPPIEGANILLEGLRQGERWYAADVLPIYGGCTHVSRGHSWNDTLTQALLVSIPSKHCLAEVAHKSYLTLLVHWFDDYVDNPELADQVFDMCALHEHRHGAVFKTMGQIGELVTRAIQKTLHPEGAANGFRRTVYGGLIAQAKCRGFHLESLLREYHEISLRGLDEHFAEDASAISPHTYLLTTKGLQELFCAVENHYDPNVAEAWSLIYGPAVYFHNHREEETIGERNEDVHSPTPDELCTMIEIGMRHSKRFYDPLREGRIEQCSFVLKAFETLLPAEVLREYRNVLT